MRKILLARLSSHQEILNRAKRMRNMLHPASEGAKKSSIQIFEYEARVNELTEILNLLHEN